MYCDTQRKPSPYPIRRTCDPNGYSVNVRDGRSCPQPCPTIYVTNFQRNLLLAQTSQAPVLGSNAFIARKNAKQHMMFLTGQISTTSRLEMHHVPTHELQQHAHDTQKETASSSIGQSPGISVPIHHKICIPGKPTHGPLRQLTTWALLLHLPVETHD